LYRNCGNDVLQEIAKQFGDTPDRALGALSQVIWVDGSISYEREVQE
jgi:hypothetical protein